MTMVSMFSFSVPLDKKDTIHTAQQVSSVALFVHGCDIAGNLAARGHRAVNACSAPLSALAAAKNSRVHGSCTCSATLTAPRAVAMPTAPAVPVAPKMHAAPCLEPRSVAAPTSSLSTPRSVGGGWSTRFRQGGGHPRFRQDYSTTNALNFACLYWGHCPKEDD